MPNRKSRVANELSPITIIADFEDRQKNTAAERHDVPRRVRAPHFGHWRSPWGWQFSLCMGLVGIFIVYPSRSRPFTSQHVADNRPRARMGMYDLDDLFAATLKLSERLGMHSERPQQFDGRIAGTINLRVSPALLAREVCVQSCGVPVQRPRPHRMPP